MRFARSVLPVTLWAAILSAALSIFVITFALTDALFLRPLPYPEAHRLFELVERDGEEQRAPSPGVWRGLPQQRRLFSEFGGWTLGTSRSRTGVTGAEFPVLRVTQELPSMLGVRLLAGRAFEAPDHALGAEPVAILSQKFAAGRFGNWRAGLYERLPIGDANVRVIGVASELPAFPPGRGASDVWMAWVYPLAGQEAYGPTLRYVVRLAMGVTPTDVAAQIQAARLVFSSSGSSSGNVAVVRLAVPKATGAAGRIVLAAQAIAIALVVIASFNVLHLMLLHQAKRRHEWMVRVALGATRRDLLWPIIRNAMLLSGIAGGGALFLGHISLNYIQDLLDLDVVNLRGAATLTTSVLTLTAGIGLVFALAATFILSRTLSAQVQAGLPRLRSDPQSGTAMRRHSRRAVLVVQIALTFPLVVGSLLLVRSYTSVVSVKPGFRADGLVTARLNRAPGHESLADTQAIIDRVAADPQVLAVAAAAGADIFDGSESTRPLRILGRAEPIPQVAYRMVSPGYMRALSLPIIAGRDLSPGDGVAAALVNQAAVEMFWKGRHPLGETLRFGARDQFTVVGVVGNARLKVFLEPETPEIFIPLGTSSGLASRLIVRTRHVSTETFARLRSLVQELSPSQTLLPFASVPAAIERTRRPFVVNAQLLAVCAGLALALTAFGAYSVLGLLFSMRLNEMGVRIAVGATRFDIARLLIREAGISAALGLGLGLAFYYPISVLLEKSLYVVTVRDTTSIVVSLGLVGVCTILACLRPMLKVARLDVVQWMRSS
jgi:putative ABC transport system permease protein